jgi:ornithine cyclodeaminase/alanine dehydrogenase-like protein (mu-crystallin family)
LQRARIFVDDIRQCRTDGEINVPLAKGLIREQDIAGEIGEVITDKKKGRRTDDELRFRTRRRCRSSTSAPWLPAWGSKRR